MLEERGEVRNLEIPVNTKDGSVQYGLFSMDSIMIGEVPCLLTTMVDITEQKILEKEMEFHEQEVMRFSRSLDMAIRKLNLLSSITRHDINNQLTVLMGYLEMLEMKQPDTSSSEYFRKVYNCCTADLHHDPVHQDLREHRCHGSCLAGYPVTGGPLRQRKPRSGRSY